VPSLYVTQSWYFSDDDICFLQCRIAAKGLRMDRVQMPAVINRSSLVSMTYSYALTVCVPVKILIPH
jgi:hypothetical protein